VVAAAATSREEIAPEESWFKKPPRNPCVFYTAVRRDTGMEYRPMMTKSNVLRNCVLTLYKVKFSTKSNMHEFSGPKFMDFLPIRKRGQLIDTIRAATGDPILELILVT
jgi:hypothetical protein